jgi:ELWxxDGT repeat protein
MRARSPSIRLLMAASVAAVALSAMALPVAAAGHPGSHPSEITTLGSRAYFAATTASHGRELWTTDGTAGGTSELKDINPTGNSDPTSLTVVGNRLFFIASDGATSKLWVTNGTLGGTIPLSDGYAYELVNVNGTLFFMRGTTIWKSDGTVNGTDSVETVPGDGLATGYQGWRSAASYEGEYFFFVDPDENGNEPWWLWRSNGTPAGTEAVDSLAPHREPTEMVVSGGLLYFNLLGPGNGGGITPGDLWVSNGTALGTKQVEDIEPDPEDPLLDADGVGDLINVAGTLYFSLWNTEVWKSNGTEAGTKRLKSFDNAFGHKMTLSRLSNKLMFSVSIAGLELWRSKGTNTSTVKVHAAGPYSCVEVAVPEPCNMDLNYKPAAVGSLFFFPSEEGPPGIELWVSDSTAAGTHLVKDISKGTGSSRPTDLARFGSKLLFVAKDGNHGRELWISDGTGPGTKLLKDINPG